MGFFEDKIKAAKEAGHRGDSEQTRRHLEHLVAEDPDALDRIKAAVDRLPPKQ